MPPVAGTGGAPPSRRNSSLLSEEELVCHAGVPAANLRWLRMVAQRWGVSLRKAACAAGLTNAREDARALAFICRLRMAASPAGLVLRPIRPVPEPWRLLKIPVPIPLQGAGEADAVVNAECFTPQRLAALSGTRERIVVADEASIAAALARTYGPALAEEAANGLSRRRPRFSAAHGICRWQRVAILLLAGLFIGAAVFAPRETTGVYGAALAGMFLLTVMMRIAAAGHVCARRLERATAPAARMLASELPVYTVLVALYREASVLPALAAGLAALDYPAAKLDIKLVLEESDADTIAAARALKLPAHFQIVVVPDGQPRTKPRALNYALQFATGDLLVIYDAEDRPEPEQLLRAANHFRRAPREVVCLQARLTFDNAMENWISRQFAIEYGALFGGILPMLSAARLPMPLGGTSNHFRIAALRSVGGWDAYNVTEDADLGLRLFRCGYRAEVLDSVTYEEACCRFWPWVKQRTRWLKGWMQTYAVHMREPRRLARELGLSGFLAFQGHFAGIIVAALVHPLSYVLIIHDGLLFDESQTLLSRNLWLLAVFNLIAGYVASLALALCVMRGKRARRLLPHLLLIPVYWLMISAACYRAVYQLVRAPHYWEKTEHGVCKWRRRPRKRPPP